MPLSLRALERDDLRIVHNLNNNRRIMSYWFEEPYESFVELEELYMKHIHDQSERRFIVEDDDVGPAGLVELVEIDQVHRRAEFQIIISPEHQNKGFGQEATLLALDYAFRILNLHKVYLVVAVSNTGAIAVYRKCGFQEEGCLKAEFFTDGAYQDALRMYRLQEEFLAG